MVTLVVVALDEGHDLCLECVGQEVVFQQDSVLQRLVSALDLASGLGMKRGAADVGHALNLNMFGQLPYDVAWPVAVEQARPVASP